MQRISDNEFELTDTELAASERFEVLLDKGHNCPDALAIVEREFEGLDTTYLVQLAGMEGSQ